MTGDDTVYTLFVLDHVVNLKSFSGNKNFQALPRRLAAPFSGPRLLDLAAMDGSSDPEIQELSGSVGAASHLSLRTHVARLFLLF